VRQSLSQDLKPKRVPFQPHGSVTRARGSVHIQLLTKANASAHAEGVQHKLPTPNETALPEPETGRPAIFGRGVAHLNDKDAAICFSASDSYFCIMRRFCGNHRRYREDGKNARGAGESTARTVHVSLLSTRCAESGPKTGRGRAMRLKTRKRKQVCKTFMHRFDSGPRLQKISKLLISNNSHVTFNHSQSPKNPARAPKGSG
jgi:hypothetical protein